MRITTGFNLAAMLAVWTFCGLAAFRLPVPAGAAPKVAWVCALLSMACAAAAVQPLPMPKLSLHRPGERVSRWDFAHLALYLGVVTGVIQAFVLTIRIMYVGIDQLRGFPWRGVREFGFNAFGLWTNFALCISCALGLLATGNAKLQTVQFWLVMMLATWACYLSDPFQPTATGGFERTDATLVLVECLASLILVGVIFAGWFTDSKCVFERWRNRSRDMSAWRECLNTSADSAVPAGFRSTVTVLALMLNVAVLYHILVPAGQSASILRMSGVRAGIAAVVAAVGGIILLRKSWGGHLADATLGLFALGLCGLATVAVPKQSMALDRQYPMILNSITIGYAVAGAIFAQLSWKWLKVGVDAPTFRRQLLPHLNRFAFFCAAAAMLSGVMMCFWPGLPGIAAMDDSLGRVLAGCAGFLLLLWVTLRSCRLLKRLSFHFLTVAVAACLVAFLVVRALPFVSDIRH